MAGPFTGGGGGSGGGGGGGGGTTSLPRSGLDSLQPNTKKLNPRVDALEQRLDELVLPPDVSGSVKRLQMQVEDLTKQLAAIKSQPPPPPAPPTPIPGQILFYVGADANADGLRPDDVDSGAIAYKKDSTGPIMYWNPETESWL